jgi:hypothetical protein
MHPHAATSHAAPDPVSLPRWAPALPHTPQLQISPPCRNGLRCRQVSHGPGPCLPTEEGSDTVACPMVPDLASLPRRAPVLPRVPRLWTLPLSGEGHWRCHASHDFQLAMGLKFNERLS